MDDGASGVFLAGMRRMFPAPRSCAASVLDLSLWHRIGVADCPSADLALQWQETLAPRGKRCRPTTPGGSHPAGTLYPTRIWEERGTG